MEPLLLPDHLLDDAHVSLPDAVLVQELADEAVIVDLNRGLYYSLNPTATRMVALLRATGSVHGAYEQLLVEYSVDAADLHRDLLCLVETLLEQELLAVAAG